MLLAILWAIITRWILYSFNNKKKAILVIAILIVIFGIWAMYSVSTYESFTVTLRSKLYENPTNYYFFFQHIKNIIIWVIAWFVVYKIPLKIFTNKKTIKIIIILALILQLAVFIPEIGWWADGTLTTYGWTTYGWARGWISLPWIPNIQPSEFFKIAYVIFMWYRLLAASEIKNEKDKILGFIVLNIILLAPFALIPDFWTAMILALTGLVMLWFSWVRTKKVWLILLWWIWIWIIWISLISFVLPKKFEYIQARLTYFISPSNEEDSQAIWRQNEQSVISIWGWGFWWQWYGKWLQKFGYIPEAQSDFIFAAYSEEIWFIWNIMLLSLYFFFMYFLIINIAHIKDPKLRMLAIWLTSIFVIQMFVNIWVNINILPNTWVTLPFISHWWSALLANIISLVILYKIIKSDETEFKSIQSNKSRQSYH